MKSSPGNSNNNSFDNNNDNGLNELFAKTLTKEGKHISFRVQGNFRGELYLYKDEFFEIVKRKESKEVFLIGTFGKDVLPDVFIDNMLVKNPDPHHADQEGEPFYPVACPFTGQVVYDEEGYHDPYPETLIAMDIDGETELMGEFCIIKALNVQLNKLFVMTEASEKVIASISEQCALKFPWFSWDMNPDNPPADSSVLDAHALIQTESDNNYYGSMAEGRYYYYFAQKKHQPKILADINEIVRFLKSFHKE